MKKILLSGFAPILNQNVLSGFDKMIKQVETLRKRRQSESLPNKTPFGKRRKSSIELLELLEVNKKQSSELSAKDI